MLGVFERKVTREILGPKKNNDGVYEIQNNEESREDGYDEANVVRTLKSIIISFAGHVSEGLIGQIT